MFAQTVFPRQQRILCVDNDIADTTVRAEVLERQGYAVVICDAPLAALRYDLTLFDLGILGFYMPEMNGKELLLRMRAQGARFPIILLTHNLDTLSRDNSILFARCIDKRLPPDVLFSTIAEFLDAGDIAVE